MLKGEFMLGLLLGTRSGIDDDEIAAHVERTVAQFRKLYPMSDRPVR